MPALCGCAQVLPLADPALMADAEFMLAATRLEATAASYAAPQLLRDPRWRAAAVAANDAAAHYFVSSSLHPQFPSLQDAAATAAAGGTDRPP